MEKELWIRYITILNNQEDYSQKQEQFHLTNDEEEMLKQLSDIVTNNPSKEELLKKIKESSKEKRQEILEQFFQPEKEKVTEEEIAKIFGVSIEKINHKYLESGKELFMFYDAKLQREVILENDSKGVFLKEKLEKIQEENDKYQTENEEENSKNILMDERNTKDLELKMYTRDEIMSHLNLLSGISQEDLVMLDYLLKYYDELHIKSINIENLIYLDESNEIYELSMNDKQEIIVNSPVDEKTSSNQYYMKDEIVNTNQNNMTDEMNQMFEEDKTEEINSLLLNSMEKPKQRVLVFDDNDGHVNKPLFIAIIALLILVIIICLIVIFKGN